MQGLNSKYSINQIQNNSCFLLYIYIELKVITFDKYGFGFDLPKPLSLANIAIIGFFLKYDYYSERSLLSKCRVRTTEYTYGR